MNAQTKTLFTTKEMVLCGMFAGLLAVVSQLSLPMPTGVPITIQLFAVALTGVVLGSRLGCLATVVYILLGAIGLPIFANFRGGLQVLTSVTGGYLWAWPAMAALCGIHPRTESKLYNTAIHLLCAVIGLALVETIGGLRWYSLAGDKTLWAIFTYSMVAFVPKDFLLTIAAVIIGAQVKHNIKKGL